MTDIVTEPVAGSRSGVLGDTHMEGLFVQLPTDVPRSSAIAYVPATLTLEVPPLRTSLLDPPAEARLLAAFLTVLHRYSQQERVATDVYLDGGRAVSQSCPCLVQCVLGPQDPILVAISQVTKQLKEARSLAASGPPVIAPRAAVPNIAFTFSHADGATIAGPGEASGSSNGVSRGTGPVRSVAAAGDLRLPSASPGISSDRAPIYDLHVFVGDEATPGGALVVVYNAGLFERATVNRLMGSFVRLFEAVGQDLTIPIHRMPLMSLADVSRVTVEWQSGHALYPQEPLHRTFERWATAQPERVAVEFQGRQLTYRELDQQSSRLAQHLISRGVKAGEPVAVCVHPSFDILVALLAIFKAGATYLPLDPTHPEALLLSILEEAEPRLLLTQAMLRDLLKPERFNQFHLDAELASLAEFPAATPAVTVTLLDPCYQLYTSGTTGKPKGVVATHGNLAHYLNVAQQKYGFGPHDTFCSLARYTFSISMFELLSPLACGAKLRLLERDDVLSPERLALTLEDVTVVHAGPSLMGNLFRYLRTNASAPRSFPRMRHASSGGDLVPPHLQEDMKLVFPNAELFVIYGSTEVSCMGTTYPIPRDEKVTRTMVGQPFWDVAVRICDPTLDLVPFGVVGEICFAGKGVVPGYFKRPSLNAEKFIEMEGMRFYRTGDLGRLHTDGTGEINLEILGRRDFQVQLRGIRIELVGIENTVRELGLAWQCAVVLKKLDEQDVRLVAFIVKPREDVTDIASFRHALASQLPDYMLPQSLVILEALPVTANGKLDRRRLQELPWQPQPAPAGSRVAPRNTVERNIAAAFASCLGVAEVGIDDDFFDLGGHSLLAVSLLEELENKLGLTFPPEVLFQHTTVRALGTYSQHSFATEPRPILLNGNQTGPTLFVLVGVHLYRGLARCLEGHYSVRSVYAGRELVMFDSPQQAPSVDELARDYVQIIRRHQPTGPYRLVGMSFGGVVAYEVARQLRAARQEVTFLGLIDPSLPEHGLERRLAQMRRLRGLPSRQLVQLVSTRVQGLVKGTLDRRHSRPEYAEYQKYRGQARFLPLEDQRQEAYRIATEDYVSRMSKYDGNALLVVAAKRMEKVLMQSVCLGWSAVIPALQVRSVDSDHLGLLEEPRVRDLADIFLDVLRQSEPEARSWGKRPAA